MMKFISLTVLFLLVTNVVTSQVVAIQNDQNNVLYLCMDNHLTVAVEGLSSKEISLSTNNGVVREDECRGIGHYIYRANTAGTAFIYIKTQISNKFEVIDSIKFRVHRLPLPTAKFGGKTTGSLDHLAIVSQLGIIAGSDSDCGLTYPISGYSILVFRKNKRIFSRNISGPRLDKATIDFFRTLRNGDQIKFEQMMVKDCDSELRQIGPIQFIVKNALSYKKMNMADTVYAEDPVTGEIVERRLDSIWERSDKK